MNIPSFEAVRRMRPRAALAMVEIALVALLAAQGARLVWMLAEPPAALPAPKPMAPPDYAILTRFDPFFRAAPDAPSAEARAFRLFGVRAEASGQGSAIIAGPDGRQASVGVGEEVAPGVTLSAVAADHVVLSRGGVRSNLYFPEGADQ